MFSDAEMKTIEDLAERRATVDEIAAAVHVHPTTLERRLWKKHGIDLERVLIRTVRLTRVGTGATGGAANGASLN